MSKRPRKHRRKDSPRIDQARNVASWRLNREAKERGEDDPDGGLKPPPWMRGRPPKRPIERWSRKRGK